MVCAVWSATMIRLTADRARRMLSIFAARQSLGLPKAPVLRKALLGLAREARLVPGNAKIGTRRWV